MRGVILGLGLALAGCAAAPTPGGRDASAPLSSQALFDPSRFADVWHVVAATGAEAGCGPLAETWTPNGEGRFTVTGTGCGPAGARAFLAEARVSGPGRFVLEGAGGRREIWILWVDADYRIAALGSPSGGGARIVARAPVPPADLLAAARDVLDFNGYDPAAMTGL